MADLVSLTVFGKDHIPRAPKTHRSKTGDKMVRVMGILLTVLLKYNALIAFYEASWTNAHCRAGLLLLRTGGSRCVLGTRKYSSE